MSRELVFIEKDEGLYYEVEILNKRSNEMISLGKIYYDNSWKQWIWEQYKGIGMAKDCLDQVSLKLSTLNELSNLLGNYP
jgi:hypothetical protein